MANPKPPKRLYKYQPFGPHAGLNLVMLVEKRSLFLPRKSALNDPTDCEPYIAIDNRPQAVLADLRKISRLQPPEPYYSGTASKVIDLLAKRSAKEPAPKKDDWLFISLLAPTPEQEARVVIDGFIRSQIGIPGVYSTSGRWDIQQMWSHYADSHRGYCLGIEGLDELEGMLVERVNYADRRPQISLDDVLEIRRNGPQARRNLAMIYCEKSNAWREEFEYRVVSRRHLASKHVTLSLPTGDFYEFPDLRLKDVYFGLRCRAEDARFVHNLIRERRGAAKAPSYYQVRQSVDSYELASGSYDPSPFPFLPPPPLPAPTRNADDSLSRLSKLFSGSE